MSQYSISLKSIINIESHNPPYNDVYADTDKKIERGREIFFNFDYDGDEKFKELFENEFIINYLTEDIYCLDVELFKLALKNDVLVKAPIFYNKYKAIEELKNTDLTLGDKTVTKRQLDEEHSANSSASGNTKTSQFPQDIENSSSFGSINYMDAGTASDNKNTSSGKAKHVETAETLRTVNAFDRIEKYLDLQLDVISDFVRSFNNLFVRIW